MTERGRGAVRQSADTFQVGPSQMHWDGTDLVIDVNEISTPHAQRIQGRIRVSPSAVTGIEVPLHGERHIWRPYAPTARITVDLARPGWRWQGHGYFDANHGTAALEADFSYWTWSRMPLAHGTASFYDADRRDGSKLQVALRFDDDGSVQHLDPPPMQRMSRGLWTVRRQARSDTGAQPYQVQAMLDAPFYVRSAIKAQINGETSVGVHEALDLNRFANPLLKFMLAVRVPRRPGF